VIETIMKQRKEQGRKQMNKRKNEKANNRKSKGTEKNESFRGGRAPSFFKSVIERRVVFHENVLRHLRFC
jgi:hypothetical protein